MRVLPDPRKPTCKKTRSSIMNYYWNSLTDPHVMMYKIRARSRNSFELRMSQVYVTLFIDGTGICQEDWGIIWTTTSIYDTLSTSMKAIFSLYVFVYISVRVFIFIHLHEPNPLIFLLLDACLISVQNKTRVCLYSLTF